jgi:hypothetical protein
MAVRSDRWTRDEPDRVAALAVLVVRAGAKDSLAWWDDDALTPAGGFVLARIFPRNPRRAALRLALRAARERHGGILAVSGVADGTTLLDLASTVDSLDAIPPSLEGPIASPDDFRRRLVALAPEVELVDVPPAAVSGLLDLTPLAGHPDQSAAERAAVLAAGYLPAQKGEPVFPFVRLARANAR